MDRLLANVNAIAPYVPANLVARDVIVGVGVGAAAIAALPVVLPLVGFTSVGVAAGSVAASVQGSSVVAGGVFATLQSLGAVGGLTVTQGVVATAAVTGVNVAGGALVDVAFPRRGAGATAAPEARRE